MGRNSTERKGEEIIKTTTKQSVGVYPNVSVV